MQKKDFPIFTHKPGLVYLDSTATSLKPQSVIDAINGYYTHYSANVFRGIYKISEEATANYEESRVKVSTFIHAKNPNEIVFVRNTTEAINLVAYSWGREHIQSGDEVVTTIMEHHSNFVPWQQLAIQAGATFKVLEYDKENFQVSSYNFQSISKDISWEKVKILAITHVSNVLGTINPIKDIIADVKRINPDIKVLVDGAQAVPHMKVDVQDLGCDFYVFSGHKMLGPTGIGVLWAREELLDAMQPFHYGGEMIQEVYIDRTTFKRAPHKFEAGTPHIAGVIGLGAAVDYLSAIGMDEVRKREVEITSYALKMLKSPKYLKLLKIYGPENVEDRGGVLAFNIFTEKGRLVHGHDVAQILDEHDICIRSGYHCAMPLHTYLDIPATARASFYTYTTKKDVDALVEGVEKVLDIFNK